MHGERLKELRQNLDLTQEDIAESLDVTAKTVSSWERGQKINSDNLQRLASTLHTSTDFLLGLTNDPRPLYEVTNDLSAAEWEIIQSLRSGNWRNALRIISSNGD